MNSLREKFKNIKRIVVKIGSSGLCNNNGQIDSCKIVELTRQISLQVKQGLEVILISSGSVAIGSYIFKKTGHKVSIVQKQAASAVGQPILMGYYQQYFDAYNLKTAQVLLTNEDLDNRERYLNTRNTMNSLLQNGVVPIVNENDTVSIKGIQFSDNDFLGALCTKIVDADLYIILSDIEGVAEEDPKVNPDAKIYSSLTINDIKELKYKLGDSSKNSLGRGGILSKIKAPFIAAQYGVPTIIANSNSKDILSRLLEGENLGTLILPTNNTLNSWKAYIAHALKLNAAIIIDLGAAKALKSGKASLLASGVVKAENEFKRGDGVSCCLNTGEEIARGIVEYNSEDINKIAGRQSDEVERILGYKYRHRGIIHRDNMVITKE